MLTKTPKDELSALAGDAGIQFNGDRPWDPRIYDDRFYARLCAEGSIGLGDAFTEGWWDCADLMGLFRRIFHARLDQRFCLGAGAIYDRLWAWIVNEQTPERAREVAHCHYDLGNDLYRSMLDQRMIYSCGYWKRAKNLDEAQEAKLDLACRKLGLECGQRVLDIGCGWGGFAAFAAERYGVEVVGVSISKEQCELAAERCIGLPVEIRLQDYRDLDEPFDHIVSIGMFEHVGAKNYRTYFEVARRCLRPEGLMLLHTIGNRVSTWHIDPWINKRIFPRALLPSASQIAQAVDGLFIVEDWHNFGTDYVPTLNAWRRNFEESWSSLSARYGEPFRRMWTYYLTSSAAVFEARRAQLWQIVLSPNGVPGGYLSIR